MAKVKVKDNRGHMKKKAAIAKFGKQTRTQKVGAHKLMPVAAAVPAHIKMEMRRQQQFKKQQQQAARPGGGERGGGSGTGDLLSLIHI